MPARVLIADDEHLFAQAVEMILASDERIEVVGRAVDGREAIELAHELKPDVVLMDLSMPGIDGFDATERILAGGAGMRVLVLSGSADPADIAKARAVGAFGYVMKENIAGELVAKILDAAA
jgi:DNA-binding NarL/FixJ family response regulator